MPLSRSRTLCHSLFALVLFATASPGAVGAQGMPSRLSDEDFWDLIGWASEPTGVFPSENFTSNEVGAQWVMPELMRLPAGGAYIGVGPEQNFNYIIAVRPKVAFLVDIRRQAMLQHLLYKALFEMAPDRSTFLSLLFSRAQPQGLPLTVRPGPLLAAFERSAPDDAMFVRTLDQVLERLTRLHGFTLSADDIEGIRHIFQITFLAGPRLSYSSGRTLGRGTPATAGSTSRLTVQYQRNTHGGVDTVRHLITTSPTGWVDTFRVPSLPRDTRVGLTQRLPGDIDTVVAPPLRNPADTSRGMTLSASLEQMLRGIPQALPAVTGTGAVDFGSLMVQTDADGVERSFLANEANYAIVRDMQLRNLIIPVVGDFAGKTAIASVGEVLREWKMKVSAFYVSNVEEYLFQTNAWRAFYDNLRALPIDERTVMVRAFLGGTRPTRDPSAPRVDLVTGSMLSLLTRFQAGGITRYADLLPDRP